MAAGSIALIRLSRRMHRASPLTWLTPQAALRRSDVDYTRRAQEEDWFASELDHIGKDFALQKLALFLSDPRLTRAACMGGSLRKRMGHSLHGHRYDPKP